MQDVATGPDSKFVGIPVEDESTKDLVSELVTEAKHLLHQQTNLMRLEIQAISEEGQRRLDQDFALMTAEVRHEGRKAVRAGSVLGAGGMLAQAGLYLVLFTIVFGLAEVMPLWAAGLIVAAVVVATAAFLIWGGLDMIKRVRFVPRQTVRQLQEDKQWMREKAHVLKSTIRANA